MSAILRVGIEEETEDVALDLFAISRDAEELPSLDDVGDGWVNYC
jgi:hypothetical protein